MNNRYTFKAKRKDNQEWVYGYYVKSNFKKAKQKHYITISDVNPYSSYCKDEMQVVLKEIIPETLCQCTELKDIDGNYIFENDIVEDIDTGDVCYLVVFDEAKFKLNKNSVNYDIDGVSDFKIISNIFDKEVE